MSKSAIRRDYGQRLYIFNNLDAKNEWYKNNLSFIDPLKNSKIANAHHVRYECLILGYILTKWNRNLNYTICLWKFAILHWDFISLS